ncbi:hypothetical protein [Luteibacter sp.]|uniref:hypothetical protein n=1 Tax=Luteibacter sp. TaxID=1886636 RepID=UPI003F7D4973
MAMVHWVQMGERQYAILEGTTRAFARVSPQGDRWVVRWRYGPRAGQGMTLRGVSLMQRMIMRWAEHNESSLRKRIPAASKPYEPPSAQERYFYDAIWPGYVPAHRRPRRMNRENH